MKAKNQIRILCDNCGCYYFWDVEFESKDYPKMVWQTPKDSNKYCPECGSQKVATQAHHSAGHFNCEIGFTDRVPRYLSGEGCIFEPIEVNIYMKDLLKVGKISYIHRSSMTKLLVILIILYVVISTILL